jgi:hypothetical protein
MVYHIRNSEFLELTHRAGFAIKIKTQFRERIGPHPQTKEQLGSIWKNVLNLRTQKFTTEECSLCNLRVESMELSAISSRLM